MTRKVLSGVSALIIVIGAIVGITGAFFSETHAGVITAQTGHWDNSKPKLRPKPKPHRHPHVLCAHHRGWPLRHPWGCGSKPRHIADPHRARIVKPKRHEAKRHPKPKPQHKAWKPKHHPVVKQVRDASASKPTQKPTTNQTPTTTTTTTTQATSATTTQTATIATTTTATAVTSATTSSAQPQATPAQSPAAPAADPSPAAAAPSS